MDLLTISAVIGGLIALFYLFSKWRYQYWTRKGVPQLEPQFIFGNYKPLITGAVSLPEFFRGIYNQAKAKGHKYVGIYNLLYPEWILTDLDIIKQIFIKDYEYFGSHGSYLSETEPLTMHLFNTEGEKWKTLRTRLTPTFTTGKMKMMYDAVLEKGRVLNEVCHDYVKNNGEINIKDTLVRYTTDVIGSVAFGLECNCLHEPNNKFRQVGNEVFIPNLKRIALELVIPHKLLSFLGYRSFAKDVSDYFTDTVTGTIKYREQNNFERKDFIQLMLQLKKQGALNSDKFSITDQEIVTEAFLFFLAGFETSSSATTFAMIELAHHQSIQDKLREEIQEALRENNGQLSYDVIAQLPYMDMVIKEALRKYPVVSTLPRKCMKTYKLPNTDLVIEKGTMVQISLVGIHNDPEYYPNPEEFNPENFSPENKAKRPDFAWMPFGEGPRKCIGLRFGLMQSKVALAAILKDFRLLPHESTKLPLEMDIGALVLTAKGGNKLKIERI